MRNAQGKKGRNIKAPAMLNILPKLAPIVVRIILPPVTGFFSVAYPASFLSFDPPCLASASDSFSDPSCFFLPLRISFPCYQRSSCRERLCRAINSGLAYLLCPRAQRPGNSPNPTDCQIRQNSLGTSRNHSTRWKFPQICCTSSSSSRASWSLISCSAAWPLSSTEFVATMANCASATGSL